MKNKSLLTMMTFTSLIFLLNGLLKFVDALSNYGVKNNFIAENWGVPVAVLLVFVFGLGWWGEYRFEQVMLSRGRKAAVVVLFGFLLIFILLLIGAWFVSTPFGFWHSVMNACASFLISGLFLRFSAADPNKIAQIQKANLREQNL